MRHDNSAPAQALVPLADRLRYMRAFRIAAVTCILAGLLLLPEFHEHDRGAAIGVSLGYLAVVLLGEAVWHRSSGRALLLFGGLLVVDGAFLTWVAEVLADDGSPLHLLILLHLVTVCLLASFRTGLKMALWNSVLLLCVFHAREAGVIEWAVGGGDVTLGGVEYRALVGDIVLFWLVAIATSTFAAVNERELKRRRYDLEALGHLALQLETQTTPEGVGRTLVEALVDDFAFQRVLLFVAREDELVLLDQHGGEPLTAQVPVRGGGPLEVAAVMHEPRLLVDIPADEEPVIAHLLPGARNLVLMPLHAEGRSVGVLVCEHQMRRGSRIEERTVSILARYASHSALALSGTWRLEQLERMAGTDGLTGVANRRAFEETLEREFLRASRVEGRFSIAMLDIDHFKKLNDTHGHLVGDEALRAVARCLDEAVRVTDTVGRYGGEEFAVLLPDLEPSQAIAACERLRARVAEVRPDLGVTVSVGVATFPGHANNPLELMRRADAALYASKRDGRNRVSAAAPGSIA